MNSQHAIRIANEVAKLISMSAAFQATYGRQYRLKPGSTADAWSLYDAAQQQQIRVAAMLDSEALNAPHNSLNKWWERQDVIDLPTAYKLMDEVTRLIACCAYFEVEAEEKEWSYTAFATQCVIAGMLHPAAIQVALDAQSHPQPHFPEALSG